MSTDPPSSSLARSARRRPTVEGISPGLADTPSPAAPCPHAGPFLQPWSALRLCLCCSAPPRLRPPPNPEAPWSRPQAHSEPAPGPCQAPGAAGGAHTASGGMRSGGGGGGGQGTSKRLRTFPAVVAVSGASPAAGGAASGYGHLGGAAAAEDGSRGGGGSGGDRGGLQYRGGGGGGGGGGPNGTGRAQLGCSVAAADLGSLVLRKRPRHSELEGEPDSAGGGGGGAGASPGAARPAGPRPRFTLLWWPGAGADATPAPAGPRTPTATTAAATTPNAATASPEGALLSALVRAAALASAPHPDGGLRGGGAAGGLTAAHTHEGARPPAAGDPPAPVTHWPRHQQRQGWQEAQDVAAAARAQPAPPRTPLRRESSGTCPPPLHAATHPATPTTPTAPAPRPSAAGPSPSSGTTATSAGHSPASPRMGGAGFHRRAGPTAAPGFGGGGSTGSERGEGWDDRGGALELPPGLGAPPPLPPRGVLQQQCGAPPPGAGAGGAGAGLRLLGLRAAALLAEAEELGARRAAVQVVAVEGADQERQAALGLLEAAPSAQLSRVERELGAGGGVSSEEHPRRERRRERALQPAAPPPAGGTRPQWLDLRTLAEGAGPPSEHRGLLGQGQGQGQPPAAAARPPAPQPPPPQRPQLLELLTAELGQRSLRRGRCADGAAADTAELAGAAGAGAAAAEARGMAMALVLPPAAAAPAAAAAAAGAAAVSSRGGEGGGSDVRQGEETRRGGAGNLQAQADSPDGRRLDTPAGSKAAIQPGPSGRGGIPVAGGGGPGGPRGGGGARRRSAGTPPPGPPLNARRLTRAPGPAGPAPRPADRSPAPPSVPFRLRLLAALQPLAPGR